MIGKESSKDKIISAASRLFQLQGYHATGLNQITKESGAPKGSLYYYFPNGKEQLAIESIQATAAFVSEQIENGLKKHADPVLAIQGFLKDMAEQFQEQRGSGGVPIAAVALETALVSEELRKACQAAYRAFQDIFARKLTDAGFEENRAKELGIVMNSMIEGAFLISFTTGTSEPLRLLAKQIPVLLA